MSIHEHVPHAYRRHVSECITKSVLWLVLTATALAQNPSYRFLRSDDPVADADAYLLTLLSRVPEAREALKNVRELQAIGQRLATSRAELVKLCVKAAPCPVEQMMLYDGEIDRAADALAKLATGNGALHGLIEKHMRPSGRFQKYATEADAALIRDAWIETARGINKLYRVYALGEGRGHMDAMDVAPTDSYFRAMLGEAVNENEELTKNAPFFAAWSQLAFDLLIINQRDEPARYEPLEETGNAAAFARAKTLDWGKWRYSAILVPGQGLQTGESGLAPFGAFRIRIAVQRWRENLAPFLIVSGGHAHPNRTPWSEAVEMKRALMGRYNVPENAILIDPYARHTPTNVRNAVRIIFSMSAPMEKSYLISTDRSSTHYIESTAFADRCANELGYQPSVIVGRVSEFDLEARPNVLSLHADMQNDLLDP